MSYSNYDIEDFLADTDFKKWVLNPSVHSNSYWEGVSMDNPELQQKMKKARQVMLQLEFSYDDPSEEEIKQSLNRILHASSKKYYNNNGVTKRRLRIALVAAACLFIALSFYNLLITNDSGPIPLQKRMVVKENPKGVKSTIMLPDGTKVTLNAQSSITYEATFEGDKRLVHLNGEAFFEVVKDASKPFVVETNYLLTTALGTSFNVNSYKEQEEEVTLLTGKVSIEKINDPGQIAFLNPGEKIEFKNGLLNKYSDVSFDNTKWKDGVLIFKRTPFEEGILVLERWYGVNIQVVNSPQNLNKNFTGIFENDNLSNVLESLGYAMRFDYQIDKKSVIITFK